MTITYRLEALDAVALAFARRDELIALARRTRLNVRS